MRALVKRIVLENHKISARKREYKELSSGSGIYVILNITNNHKYIGQSKNIKDRWADHKWSLNGKKHSNSYLQNAWNLYGKENFKFEVLELCGYGELNEKEQYWIERLKPEYNIAKNVYEWYRYKREDDKGNEYKREGESFTRPKWHLWVYGGHKKDSCS